MRRRAASVGPGLPKRCVAEPCIHSLFAPHPLPLQSEHQGPALQYRLLSLCVSRGAASPSRPAERPALLHAAVFAAACVASRRSGAPSEHLRGPAAVRHGQHFLCSAPMRLASLWHAASKRAHPLVVTPAPSAAPPQVLQHGIPDVHDLPDHHHQLGRQGGLGICRAGAAKGGLMAWLV